MRSDILKLIGRSYVMDENGVSLPEETSREVYCRVGSVSASEFFEGARSGLRPEIRFTMFRFDYDNEEVCEYEGARYRIYRTYISGDYIELYCELGKGVE